MSPSVLVVKPNKNTQFLSLHRLCQADDIIGYLFWSTFNFQFVRSVMQNHCFRLGSVLQTSFIMVDRTFCSSSKYWFSGYLIFHLFVSPPFLNIFYDEIIYCQGVFPAILLFNTVIIHFAFCYFLLIVLFIGSCKSGIVNDMTLFCVELLVVGFSWSFTILVGPSRLYSLLIVRIHSDVAFWL